MSDTSRQTPTPPPDDQGSSAANGGWHQPQTRNVWQAAEKEADASGWQVPALPPDMSQESTSTGGWHLPSPEDTTFKPEDQITIQEAAPEDALFALATSADIEPRETVDTSRPIAPEDALFNLASDAAKEATPSPQAPGIGAPEDILAMLERIEDVEEEQDTAFASELFALTNLAQAEAESDSTEVETIDPAEMSPVERALRQSQPLEPGQQAQSTTPADQATIDAAEYARRQLEQLQADDAAPTGAEIPLSTQPGGVGGVTGQVDPAEYARRQLEQLDQGFTPVPQGTAPMPSVPQVDPRVEELARRFRQTQEDVTQLRYMRRSGQITEDQFQEQLRNRMILDDDQVYWMLGAENDIWYKYINNEWVPAVPPALQATGGAGITGNGGTGGTPTIQFTDDSSLPITTRYEPDAAQQQTYGAGGIDDILMPRPVPTTDPNLTVVGPSFMEDVIPHQQETVPSSGFGAEATVPARPVDYGGTEVYTPGFGVEAAIDEAEPPDLSGVGETPLYAEARERRQASFLQIAFLSAITLLGIVFVIGAIVVFAALSWYNGIVSKYESQIAGLQNYRPVFQTVIIQDYMGDEIATLSPGGNQRITVQLDEINSAAIHAVISQENPTFYSDPGWEVTDTLGAFFQSVTGGSPVVARTITQRVVDELIIPGQEGITPLESAVIAGELTNRYSKDFILALYLNEFSFGNQAFGIEAASNFYFNKSAEDLNGSESALLAAIGSNPEQFDPVIDREGAFAEMERVITKMLALGCLNTPSRGEICIRQGDIPASQRAQVKVLPFRPRQFDTDYPHFVNLVRAQLEASIPDLYQSGYTVRTTLVPVMQDEIQRRLRNYLQNSAITNVGITTGAAMWVDPQTGAIRAYVGSPDYNNAEIDGEVDQLRLFKSPGETIYPVIYAAALSGVDRNGNGAADLDEYLTPASILFDVPSNFGGFTPRNFYQDVFYGPVPVRQALINTYRVSAAKAFDFVGADRVNVIAEEMGLHLNEPLTINAVAGETQVRLNDLMAAYATIANNGRANPVYAIESISLTGGRDLPLTGNLERTPVESIQAPIAFLLQNILTDDNSRNRAVFPPNSALTINGRPTQGVVAAVAGTGAGNADLWTIGFTNNAVVGVWLGRNDQVAINPAANGFNAAGPFWNEVMRTVLNSMSGQQPVPFPVLQNVTQVSVCPDTGIREGAGFYCTRPARPEYFAVNRQPPTPDQGLTATRTVNTWTGQIATDSCPNPEDRETRQFVNIRDNFAIDWLRRPENNRWLQTLGLPAALDPIPTAFCDLNSQVPLANITSPPQGSTLIGNVQILGQVSAPANFSRYTLEYAPIGQTNFRPITPQPITTQQTVPNSVLAEWNTTTVPDGQYELRLTVTATDGGFVYRRIQVNIDNPDPTATPTPTEVPPTPTSQILFPTLDPGFTPLPFDTPSGGDIIGGPTPTIDPF